MSIAFVCYSCGNRLEVAEYTRKKIRCPSCGVMCEVPRPSDMTRSEEPAAQESRSGPRRRAATPRNDALQPSPSSAAGAIAAGPPPRAPASEQPLTDITAAPPRPTTLPQSQCPQCHELLAPGTKACPVCCYE